MYDVCPVPPLATGNVPVTPVDNGKPVALVNVAADGVPRFGVVSVGLVLKTTEPAVPVVVYSPTKPPLSYKTRPVVPPVMVDVPIIRLLPLGGMLATLTMADGLAGFVGLLLAAV